MCFRLPIENLRQLSISDNYPCRNVCKSCTRGFVSCDNYPRMTIIQTTIIRVLLCFYLIVLGDIDIAKLLVLEHRADVNIRDKDGETPLHYATENDHILIVRLLLMSQAYINARSKKGRTPLHAACDYCRVKIARLLLGRGANANDIDSDGKTSDYRLNRLKRCSINRLLGAS